jgi:hypothetical protein
MLSPDTLYTLDASTTPLSAAASLRRPTKAVEIRVSSMEDMACRMSGPARAASLCFLVFLGGGGVEW